MRPEYNQVNDVLTQPLYDTVIAHPGRSTTLFVDPVGRGASCFGDGLKHYGDTNMFLSAQLPAGYNFRVRSVYVEPIETPGLAGAPWPGLAGAALEFVIGVKSYLTIPVSRARVCLPIFATSIRQVSDIVNTLREVHPSAHPMVLAMTPGFVLGFDVSERQLELRQAENFTAHLRLPPYNPALPASDALPVKVRVYLNGILYRPIQ